MRLRWLKRGKTPHCYHLVTIKTAVGVPFFAAPGANAFPTSAPCCELLSMMFLICSFFSFVLRRRLFGSMTRASSHALKHPPVAAPSEPAGATPFPELAVAIERERPRRGREPHQPARPHAAA